MCVCVCVCVLRTHNINFFVWMLAWEWVCGVQSTSVPLLRAAATVIADICGCVLEYVSLSVSRGVSSDKSTSTFEHTVLRVAVAVAGGEEEEEEERRGEEAVVAVAEGSKVATMEGPPH